MKYYSQFGQDKWLYENIFKDKKNGFFIEIGADDGIDKSNTKLFEDLGWDGICIEPSPTRFNLLSQNRKCICVNYAVSSTEGTQEFMDIIGWGKGLSGIVDKYCEKHKERISLELNNKDNHGFNLINVQSKNLNNILSEYNINNIDFCSIDTEGSEEDIIKSLDLEQYNIKVLLIENNYSSFDINMYLSKNGYYYLTTLEIDDVYISNSMPGFKIE